jgi:hypothetical protein
MADDHTLEDYDPGEPTGLNPERITTGNALGWDLRDYFAGQALAGMHARDSFDDGQASPEQRARLAYIDADAMIAARSFVTTRTKEAK